MLIYILKSAACLAILFVFYKLFLENENMHKFKRFYLLGSLLFALIVPNLVFSEYIVVEPEPNFKVQQPILNEYDYVGIAPAIEKNFIDITLLLWITYFLGMLFFGIKFLRNLFQIFRRIHKNPKYKSANFIHVLIQEKIAPHTFFKYIFLNKLKFESKEIPKEVLLHEETHARQKHSFDVVFIELLQVIFWVNPLIYFFKIAIKLNHEFLADQAVLNEKVDSVTYQNTLLSFLSSENVKKYQPTLPNAFNYSSIKKRITIMKTKTSRKSILLRITLLLPLIGVLLTGFSEKKIVPVEKELIKNNLINHSSIIEKTSTQSVQLGGLILDSETLKPLKGVEILGANGNILSKTDNRGFYNAQFANLNEEEIRFEYTLRKKGYKPVKHNEHWGNLHSNINFTYYFGMQREESNTPDFSQYIADNKNLSYKSIVNNFYLVENRFVFNKKINIAKTGNQHALLKIDEIYYLVSSTGWIQINSKEDLISINDNQIIPASKINDLIKRDEITGMTPLKNRKALFAIYTIPVDHAVRPIKYASNEQIETYNTLAKKYNAIPIAYRKIPLSDLKLLETSYRKMNQRQKAKSQPFPECTILKNVFRFIIDKQGTIKADNQTVTLDNLYLFLERYNSESTKEEKQKIVRAYIFANVNTQNNIISGIEDILVEYGVAQIEVIGSEDEKYVVKKQDDVLPKLVFKYTNKGQLILNDEVLDIKELKSKLDAVNLKDNALHFEVLVYAENASEDDISELLHILKEVAGIKKVGIVGKDTEQSSNQEGATKKQVADYNALAKKYNDMLAESKSVSIKKSDVDRLEYLFGLMSKEQKANAELFPDFPEPPPLPNLPAVPHIKKGEKSNIPPQPQPSIKAPRVKKGEKSNIPPPPPSPNFTNVPVTPEQATDHLRDELKSKNSSREITEIPKLPNRLTSTPPLPPAPKSPLDHVIEMAKKNAIFYYEGKKISSDKAIEIIKKNDEINIHSTGSKSKKPVVKLSAKPIKIGSTYNTQEKTKPNLPKIGLVTMLSNESIEMNKIGKRLLEFTKNYNHCTEFYINGKFISKNKARNLFVKDFKLEKPLKNQSAAGLSVKC